MRAFLKASLVLAIAAGCQLGPAPSSGNGQRGVLTFSIAGTPTTTPLMVGSALTLNVASDGSSSAIVQTTSDTGIVAVGAASSTECDGTAQPAGTACPSGESTTLLFPISAVAPGATVVSMLDSFGATIDSVVLTVETGSALQVTCGGTTAPSLAQGATCPLAWTFTDAAGVTLNANNGVSLATTNTSVTLFDDFFPDADGLKNVPPPGLFNSPNIKGAGPGTATVTASSGSITSTLQVTVTD